jgi:hypothetical protein
MFQNVILFDCPDRMVWQKLAQDWKQVHGKLITVNGCWKNWRMTLKCQKSLTFLLRHGSIFQACKLSDSDSDNTYIWSVKNTHVDSEWVALVNLSLIYININKYENYSQMIILKKCGYSWLWDTHTPLIFS